VTEIEKLDDLAMKLDPLQILRIATNRDPEVRNHQIALAYWEMSRRLDPILHNEGRSTDIPARRSSNANWFTFATWRLS
jgi:hypothetical protein